MAQICDHTSVGILVKSTGRLLLIERRKYPIGFAPPAGHVDNYKGENDEPNFEAAARAELFEEVGLTALELKLVAEGRKENPCRRPGGTWHYWKVYCAVVSGNVRPSPKEVKRFEWCSISRLRALAERTREFKAGKVTQADWDSRPGLEPVWLEWLTELKLLEDSDVER